MKNKLFLILGIGLVVIGSIISAIANFENSAIIGFASVMLGAGISCSELWEKRDKSKSSWLAIIALICIGLGCFCLGFMGFAETTVISIISGVIGFVVIIIGILTFQKIKTK